MTARRTSRPGRSLRARLVLFITAALVVVCAAMALTTVLVQRAHLLDELDQRVRDAAARSQGGLERRTGSATDLGFLNERGRPAGPDRRPARGPLSQHHLTSPHHR